MACWCYGCRATEPGSTQNIGGIEIWMIDWLIDWQPVCITGCIQWIVDTTNVNSPRYLLMTTWFLSHPCQNILSKIWQTDGTFTFTIDIYEKVERVDGTKSRSKWNQCLPIPLPTSPFAMCKGKVLIFDIPFEGWGPEYVNSFRIAHSYFRCAHLKLMFTCWGVPWCDWYDNPSNSAPALEL